MIARCPWADKDPMEARYHDEEWGIPMRDSRDLWEQLILEGFQAGLSWRTILHRREGFRRAFDQFDPVKVAAYGPDKVEELMADTGIIRARAKIEATIGNARIYLAMAERGEDFSEFLWSFVGGAPQIGDGVNFRTSSPESLAMSKALKAKGYKFVGATIAYAFMQATGMVNDHAIDCPFRRV